MNSDRCRNLVGAGLPVNGIPGTWRSAFWCTQPSEMGPTPHCVSSATAWTVQKIDGRFCLVHEKRGVYARGLKKDMTAQAKRKNREATPKMCEVS